jgi:hypothetical protein
MNITRFTSQILLLAMLFCATGCTAWWFTGEMGKAPQPDPLAGWKSLGFESPNKAITDDYNDYILKLPSEERNYIGSIHFFEDGTGQHAVSIEIALSGTDWSHVIIYDKDNKRMKVIRYVSGHYRS